MVLVEELTMWTVAGLLLGFVVLASLAGFHVGPHSHLAAGVVGVIAAAWLLVMAATGHAEPLLWAAFSADVLVTGAVGTIAVKGIEDERHHPAIARGDRLEGAFGKATTDLDPDGVVQVQGESWSATSLNGPIRKGSSVQVIQSGGVRLGVWGEDADPSSDAPTLGTTADLPTPGEAPDEQRTQP